MPAAKTPDGMASGPFRPHHCRPHGCLCRPFSGSWRLNGHAGQRQPYSNRAVREACKKHGGFISARSAVPPQNFGALDAIRHVEVLEYPEVGWKLSGRLRSKTSLPLSLSMTKETISSIWINSDPAAGRAVLPVSARLSPNQEARQYGQPVPCCLSAGSCSQHFRQRRYHHQPH